MEIQIADSRCVVLQLHQIPRPEICEGMVCAALIARNLQPWPATEIHLYPGKEDCLLVAFPRPAPRIGALERVFDGCRQ